MFDVSTRHIKSGVRIVHGPGDESLAAAADFALLKLITVKLHTLVCIY